MTQTIKIVVSVVDTKKEISLTKVLKAQDVVLDNQTDVHIDLEVLPDVCCTLVDDVSCINAGKQTINVTLASNATVDYAFKPGNKKNHKALEKHITFIFQGSRSHGRICCAYHAKNDEVLNLTVIQDHRAADTTSSCIIKSVLDGKAQLKGLSLIKVDKHSAHVKASQMSKTLMLSDSARCFVAPQLEVENYESECRHGASISSISQEDLFYLQSRGIDGVRARYMLISAFLSASK